MPTEQTPPKVFISYSHDSRSHLDQVLELADRLRAEGIDCNLDQYEPAPTEGWPRWMDRQFKDADYILVICTETYCRRFEGREEHGKGLGVKWEGAIITDELYRNETVNKRFIPIVFTDADAAHVPERLQHFMRYDVTDESQYESLYRHLTGQPRVVKPPLGKLRSFEPVNKLRALPTEDRQQEFAPIQEDAKPKPQLRHESFVENLGGGVTLDMIAIPGGSFLMGSEDFPDTRPVHRVKLSPFHLGKYPVTQAQWKAVMGDNPSYFKGDKRPVEMISWEMAVEFCQMLTAKTGRQYRLPTEAEWEYACLAGSTGKYCFGDDEALLEKYAWYDEGLGGSTHPVGEKLPNNWGLYDMHGNVLEWCQDWYDANYYAELSKQGEVVDPQGPASGTSRVLRGGSWIYNQMGARAVFRDGAPPGGRDDDFGFRVVYCRPPSS